MPTGKSRAPFLTVLPIGMLTPAYTQCAIGLVPWNPLTVDTALAGFAFARLCVVYELSNFLILATIARFYMTTQRTLSAATLASRGTYALNSSFQSRVSSLQILIANARLEFSVTHRENSPVKISNRERIAIFHSRSATAPLDFLSPLITHHLSLITGFLIYGGAIRNPCNPLKT
jgi:hypothetical protein